MDKPVSKHRQTVTKGQLEVLNLLLNFRYGTNDLFAAYFGKKDRSFVHKRMAILLERGLVGRRFDKSYRLHGKPGAYYLTPEGARLLQAKHGIEINIKKIYKDKELTEQFIRYSLELFTIYNRLRTQYGNAFGFYTRSVLSREDYEYFPQPLPHAYATLKTGKQKKQFFLEILHDDQPWFIAVRTILKYVSYAEDGDWEATETNLPSILLVCESERLAKRVLKRFPKAVVDSYEEDNIEFAVAVKADLLSEKTTVWRTQIDDSLLKLEQLDEWTD
jgi:hypothetical protein